MIETSKMNEVLIKINPKTLSTEDLDTRTSGNWKQTVNYCSRLAAREYFFGNRVPQKWNEPSEGEIKVCAAKNFSVDFRGLANSLYPE